MPQQEEDFAPVPGIPAGLRLDAPQTVTPELWPDVQDWLPSPGGLRYAERCADSQPPSVCGDSNCPPGYAPSLAFPCDMASNCDSTYAPSCDSVPMSDVSGMLPMDMPMQMPCQQFAPPVYSDMQSFCPPEDYSRQAGYDAWEPQPTWHEEQRWGQSAPMWLQDCSADQGMLGPLPGPLDEASARGMKWTAKAMRAGKGMQKGLRSPARGDRSPGTPSKNEVMTPQRRTEQPMNTPSPGDMTPGGMSKMVQWKIRTGSEDADWSDRKKRRDQPRRVQGPLGGGVLWLGRVAQLARDPQSSRMMQRDLRELDAEQITTVVQEVAPHFCFLMNDAVGNYFCQAVLEVCSVQDLAALVTYAGQEIVQIALSRHGTCAVQKLLVQVVEQAPELVPQLTEGLHGAVAKLTKDSHGHYVIECLLDLLSHEQSSFIVEAMRGHCAVVGTHRQGCLVLQKCFHRQLDQQLVALGEEVAQHATKLAQDPFGNYVVQHVLTTFQNHPVQRLIASNMKYDLVKLATQKFSSNVVEHCFKVVDDATRSELIDELIAEGSQRLTHVAKDQYGNYVVQKMLQTCSKPQLEKVCAALKSSLEELEASGQNGRRIVANLKKTCPQLR